VVNIAERRRLERADPYLASKLACAYLLPAQLCCWLGPQTNPCKARSEYPPRDYVSGHISAASPMDKVALNDRAGQYPAHGTACSASKPGTRPGYIPGLIGTGQGLIQDDVFTVGWPALL